MKTLKAVSTTQEEADNIGSAVCAIRTTLKRFREENSDAVSYAPTVILQVSEIETHVRLSLLGHPEASGRSLDEAFAELAAPEDATMLRKRAKAMRDTASRMERDADAMEGIGPGTPAPADEGSQL